MLCQALLVNRLLSSQIVKPESPKLTYIEERIKYNAEVSCKGGELICVICMTIRQLNCQDSWIIFSSWFFLISHLHFVSNEIACRPSQRMGHRNTAKKRERRRTSKVSTIIVVVNLTRNWFSWLRRQGMYDANLWICRTCRIERERIVLRQAVRLRQDRIESLIIQEKERVKKETADKKFKWANRLQSIYPDYLWGRIFVSLVLISLPFQYAGNTLPTI